MPIPRVFVSSTCYDLKYIRENLRFFIRTLGYEPILSEDGAVFYNPSQNVEDACLSDVSTVQLFVLVIGGRFGSRLHGAEKSITNAEYDAAISSRIPVFALVEESVAAQYELYSRNKDNPSVDLTKFQFSAVDSLSVFKFLESVRKNAVNNAIQPFRDFADVESYLKKQWAGMMFDFLSKRSEAQRVSSTLEELTRLNERIEVMSKFILESVGTERHKLEAMLYEEMIASAAIRDLSWLKVRPTPALVLTSATFSSCASAAGTPVVSDPSLGMGISSDGRIGEGRLRHNENDFQSLRVRLREVLNDFKQTVESYTSSNVPA